MKLALLAASLVFLPAAARAREAAGASPFRCTLVLGVAVTSEWFAAGFERQVDDARWEAITKPHTTLAQWGDPHDPVWSLPPTSPCASGAGDPDRVLFTAMEWSYTTAAEWTAALTAVADVLRAKYPHARQVELLTMIRAPGNVSCGNTMSVVPPFVDEAIGAVSANARFQDVVRAGPKLEAGACAWFKNGGPHFTPDGAAAMAERIARTYGGKR